MNILKFHALMWYATTTDDLPDAAGELRLANAIIVTVHATFTVYVCVTPPLREFFLQTFRRLVHLLIGSRSM